MLAIAFSFVLACLCMMGRGSVQAATGDHTPLFSHHVIVPTADDTGTYFSNEWHALASLKTVQHSVILWYSFYVWFFHGCPTPKMVQVLHITYSNAWHFSCPPRVSICPRFSFLLYMQRGVFVSQSLVSLRILDNCFYELATEGTCFADRTSLKTINSLALWFVDHFSVSQPWRIRIFFS